MDMLPPTRIVSNLSCVQQKLNSSDQFILNANSWELPSEAVVQTWSVKKKRSQKLHKIHKKTPVLGSLFNKVQTWGFIKKEILATVFSSEFFEIFKNTFYTEQIWWLLLCSSLTPPPSSASMKRDITLPTKWISSISLGFNGDKNWLSLWTPPMLPTKCFMTYNKKDK